MRDEHADALTVEPLARDRARVELAIDELSDHNFWCDLSADLAAGGVFVATHRVLALGTIVEIELELPDVSERIAMTGVVRWTSLYSDESDGHAGVGLKFLPLDPESLTHVQHFASTRREPLLYDLDEAPIRARRQPSGGPPRATKRN